MSGAKKGYFDFAALVARAEQDDPDAQVFAVLERERDAWKALGGANRHTRSALSAQWQAQRGEVVKLRPVTPEGVAAMLRWAINDTYSCPATKPKLAVLRAALEFIDPPSPRRGRPAAKGAGGTHG